MSYDVRGYLVEKTGGRQNLSLWTLHGEMPPLGSVPLNSSLARDVAFDFGWPGMN